MTLNIELPVTNPDLKPRATWWAFKKYADLTGTLVELKQDKTMAGLAAVEILLPSMTNEN